MDNKDNIIQDGVYRRLLETPQIRKVDEESRTVEFVASDNSVDSYKTVLPVDKWDLIRYDKNGVVGYMHDVYGNWAGSSDPDDVIGKGEAFVEGDQLIIRVIFEPKDLNEKADKIFRKVKFGSLKAVSVGFAPTGRGHLGDETRGEDPDVYYYDGQELLEVSVVNIPSNKNAVKRAFGTDVEAIDEERRAAQAKKDKKPAPAEPEDPKKNEDERSIDISLTIAKARRVLAQN